MPWTVVKPQVVRPFPEIKDALKTTLFRLGPDRDYETRDTYEPREVNVATLQPEFRFALADELKKLPGLSLVISLHDASLHLSDKVFECKLDKAPETYQLPVDVVRRFGWKAGVRVVVTIMQAADQKPKPGQPWMRGHWVARHVITIGAKPKARSFPVEPWPAEEFTRRQLPDGTVYWLEFVSTNLNQKFKDPKDAFRLGIRQDVYDALATNQESPATRAAFALLMCETVTDLIVVGFRDLEGEDLERGTTLDNLFKRLSQKTGLTKQKVESLAKQEDGRALIRAHVQKMLDTADPLVRLRRSG